MSDDRDAPVFMRLLWMHGFVFHGILRSWMPPLCLTSMGSTYKR